MTKTIININENNDIIALGQVKHASVTQTLTLPTEALPEGLWENLSEYGYQDGKVVKRAKINAIQEQNWQRMRLNETNAAIAEYQADKLIDERYSELRTSTHSEEEYYQLLGDRKLLIEYVQQADFPQCGRPKLSGLGEY